MTPDGGAGSKISPTAVIAALVLFALGVYPLPLLLPDHGGVGASQVNYWVGAGLLTLGPVLALAAMPFAWLRAVPARAARLLRWPPPLVFALMVGLAFAGLSVLVASYAYRFAPTRGDEIAQLWHARILLHGRLSLPADPNFEFFAADQIIDQGAWYSQFPIGGPLVLTLGYLMREPWLLGPLLGAFTAMALYHFARRAYGETQGRAVAALFTLAPVTLLMSASYMNHVPVLLLVTLALAALVEWERADAGWRRLLLAAGIGVALGFTATIRPVDALVVAAAVGVFQLYVLARDRGRWRDLVLEVLVALVGVSPLLYANWATNGGMFHFAYDVLWGSAQHPGFHVDPQGVPYTPMLAVARAARYASELNATVVQWPVPALLVVVAGLLSGRRASRWGALLLGLLGLQLFAYAIYWHDGEFLGPRYMYTVVPVVVILLARAPFFVAQRWGGYWRHAAPLAALTCIAVAWTMPMGPYGANGMVRQLRAAAGSFKVDLAAATRAAGAHHALVLVHVPFSGQLMRRLWGVGFTRSAAADVFAHGDACSVLEAVRTAESDSIRPPAQRARYAAERIATYARGAAPVHAVDPTIQISSERSVTQACRSALDGDAQFGAIPFGLGLLLEPITREGRLNGDVIYVADLGDHNEALRARFGDRKWYRAWAERRPDGTLRAVVGRYESPALDAVGQP
jgi:4-amino-4-deoxy-L-arabinose transferase-like glycosyltransferase